MSEGEENDDDDEVEEAAAGDSESDIRQLKARRHVLANKLVQQQKRRQKIQVNARGGEKTATIVSKTQKISQQLFLKKVKKCRLKKINT